MSSFLRFIEQARRGPRSIYLLQTASIIADERGGKVEWTDDRNNVNLTHGCMCSPRMRVS